MGAISQRSNIDKKIAKYIITGGTLGSVAGAFFAGLIPALPLAVIFVVICIVSVFGIYFNKIFPVFSREIHPDAQAIVIISFFLNLITGIRGFRYLLWALRLLQFTRRYNEKHFDGSM